MVKSKQARNQQVRKSVMRVLLPFILLLLMLLDGQISHSLRPVSNNYLYLNSHLMLIGLVIGCLYYQKRYMVTLAVFLGLFFDVYYYSIIGINVVAMPLTVLLIYVVFDYVRPSIISILLSLVIFITIMDSSAYILQAIFKIIKGDTLGFVVKNLGPTLVMNGIFFILLIWPIKKMTSL